jgi:hypothetical protein
MTLSMQPAPPIKLTNILGDAELEMWNTNAGILSHSMATFIANKFSQLSDQQCREVIQDVSLWVTPFNTLYIQETLHITLYTAIRNIVKQRIMGMYEAKFAYRWFRFGKADYHLFIGTPAMNTWGATYHRLMTLWANEGFETEVRLDTDGRIFVVLHPTEDGNEPDESWGKYDEEDALDEGHYIYYVGYVIEEKNNDKI